MFTSTDFLGNLMYYFSRVTFRFWEMFGLHVMPVHFTSPIAATRDLTDALFERQSECVGVDWNVLVQLHYLQEVFPCFTSEGDTRPAAGLSRLDAAVLHAMFRHHRPRHSIEIGSGSSTQIAIHALQQNAAEGAPGQLMTIDPYLDQRLRGEIRDAVVGRPQTVQSMGVSEFADCDLLFVDSSHVVKISGDVNFEILEILPRLKPGCTIHFHDILLPGKYWSEWVKDKHWFWSEQYLLWAFLLFNTAFEILWASRYMHLHHRENLQRVFPFFEPDRHRITSFWIRRRPDTDWGSA